MFTKIIIKNFKRLNAEIDLSAAVVFVGPNNSGKTSALQAITLWDIGMRKWAENRNKTKAKQRVGVVINRKDILTLPVHSAKQLWKDLHVREITKKNGKQETKYVNMEITMEGFTNKQQWKLGFEFYYSNPESFYCRIIKDKNGQPIKFPEIALTEKIGFLPPMSGLASDEDKLVEGSINSRIGEGRTAEVLRNLCLIVHKDTDKWPKLVKTLGDLFKIEINAPIFDNATGKIHMTYREGDNTFDLANSGRGFQQILLLFAYIYSGDNKILLIDEPDAHLEIIRQKDIFNILSKTVKKEQAQLIIATHSEVILEEAWQKDKVIAFIGKPHIVNSNNRSQVSLALTDIGYDQYLLAEEKKWILYLESSTDLAVLEAFAKVLRHPAEKYLKSSFVKYCCNVPVAARKHFFALKQAVPDLFGVAIFDKLDINLQNEKGLEEIMWKRREIENYLPIPHVLERYVSKDKEYDLFSQNNAIIISNLVKDYAPPIALKNQDDDWWFNTKISDDFLDKVFAKYFKKLNMPVLLDKGNYYQLAELSMPEELDVEIKEKLDKILKVAQQVKVDGSD
ncbi:MAG: AAA family ATPase [Elusimicrobia bacterium]|nr:AAA family ATPase [Elusimicrobiota bacterium]